MENTTHLIGYGLAPAKTVSELNVGDVIIWNYGIRGKVLEVKPCGKVSSLVKTIYENGKEYVSTYRNSKLVAYSTKAFA